MQSNELPEFHRIDYSSEFARRLQENFVDTGNWVALCRDPETGHYWQYDEWDKYHVGLAIRIHDPDNWRTFDDLPVRVAYLVQSRGGVEEAECMWAGCTRKRLKGIAYCPECAYEKAGIRE